MGHKPSHPSPDHLRRLAAAAIGLTLLTTLALPFAALAPAAAAPTSPRTDGSDPLGSLLNQVTQTVEQVAQAPKDVPKQIPKPQPKPQPQPKQDPQPKPAPQPKPHPATSSADQGHGTVGHTDLAHHDLVDLSSSQAGSDHQGSAAHAALLGVAGTTLIGSQAGPGNAQGSGPVPDNPLCQVTRGALCADLLYADSAVQGGHAASSTGAASLCLGGDDPSGASCSGQQVGLANSAASHDTGADGSSTSSGSSSLGWLCLTTGSGCEVSGTVLGSQSGAGQHGTPGEAPQLAVIGLGGKEVAAPRDPVHTDVARGCTTPSLLCSTLNAQSSGSSSQQAGSAGAATLGGGQAGVVLGDSGASSSDAATAEPPTTGPAPGTSGSASAQLTDLAVGDSPLLQVSKNQSSGSDGKTAGDASLLGIAGVELIGAHATSGGTTSDAGPVPGNPLCERSAGALCLDLLPAQASASHTGSSEQAQTRTGIADACVGGTDPSGASCSGLSLGIGDGSSSYQSSTDPATGASSSSASSSSSAATTCLKTGSSDCAVSGDVLASHGSASGGSAPTSGGTIADLGLSGTGVGAPGDPITLSVPVGCPGSAVCVLLNQGTQASGVNGGSAGHTVVGTGLVGDTVAATLAQVSVSAPSKPGTTDQPPSAQPPSSQPPALDPPQVAAANPAAGTPQVAAPSSVSSPGAALPRTGGISVGLLWLGAGLLLAGGLVLTRRLAVE